MLESASVLCSSFFSIASHNTQHPTHTHTQRWTQSLKRQLQPPAVPPLFRPQPSPRLLPHLGPEAPACPAAQTHRIDMSAHDFSTKAARDLNFFTLDPLALTWWLARNPGHEEDRDSHGYTALWAAARRGDAHLVSLLVDTHHLNVNGRTSNDSVAIHHAIDAYVLGFLIDRGAEPVVWNDKGWTPLMHQVRAGRSECVARLLKDPRVRASIDTVARGDDFRGFTALHLACCNNNVTPTAKRAILRHVLLAGADPTLPNEDGLNSLQILQEYPPVQPLELALVEEAMDGQRAASLIKARQVVVGAGRSEAWRCVKQNRLQRGEAMPSIELDTEDEEGEDFGSLVAFLMGLQSEEGRSGMPLGVFVLVMSMLIPPWHALREGIKGVE